MLSRNEPKLYGPAMSFTQITKPNRPWFLKMVIFLIALVGFGLYGLYDATVSYPARGLRHAQFQLYTFLDAAQTENLPDSQVTVEDPAAELKRLGDKGGERLTGAEGAKFAWLKALSTVGKLKPDMTRIGGSDARKALLTKLKAEWTTGSAARNAPKPLASYDIAVQWIFTALGLGGGLALFLHIIRILARKYRWDPEAKQLQLPDGSTLSPSDVEDFDKRKWDKFLIFLKIKPGHTPHGGKELKLDLYQHNPLESWVLEMERIAFPDREPPAAAATPSPAPAAG